jgi:hypothetical protein
MARHWGDVKSRAALLAWPDEVVLLQAQLASAEERLMRARTDAERGVALRAVSEAAARLEAAKREAMAR